MGVKRRRRGEKGGEKKERKEKKGKERKGFSPEDSTRRTRGLF
jgi:hypothetical protein